MSWTRAGLVAVLAVVSALYWGDGAPSGNDAHEYRRLAANLLDGHGYSLAATPPYEPSAKRVPGYPLFLAAVYGMGTRSDAAVRVAQALVWGAGCAVLARTLGRLAGARAGTLAALVVAGHPGLARTTGEILSESLFTVVTIVLVAALARALSGGGAGWALVTGGLVGVAALVRPIAAGLVPVLWLAAWLARTRLGTPVRWAVLTTLATLAVIAPWTVRNALVLDRVILLQPSQSLAINVWLATLPYHEQPIEGWGTTGPRLLARYPELGGSPPGDAPGGREAGGPVDRGPILLRAAVARIAADPVAYIRSRARAYPHLWLTTMGPPWLSSVSFGEAWRRGDWARLAGKALYVAAFSIVPLTLTLVLLLRDGLRPEHLALWAVPVFTAVVYLPLWIEARYALPAQPLLWGLAALGARPWLERAARR